MSVERAMDLAVIDRFAADMAWLANWSPARVVVGEHVYPTADHGYAAAKTSEVSLMDQIAAAPTAMAACELGREASLPANWDSKVRFEAMWAVLAAKFQDSVLSALLAGTGDALLVDVTQTHDQHWSDCRCPVHSEIPGGNHVGRTLMALRAAQRSDPSDRWPRAAVVGIRDLNGQALRYVQAEIPRVLRKLRIEHGTSTLISGFSMGAGVEIAELAGHDGGYRLWAYLPYPDQTAAWPMTWVRRQEAIRSRVSRTVVLGDKPAGADRRRSFRLDADRDRLIVRDASVLIAVYDRTAGGAVPSTVASARALGLPVIIVDPVTQAVAISS